MLNISELRNTAHEKRRRRIETFDRLLEMCHKRIRRAAELEKFECEYDVPEYVMGLPLFNVNDCLDHIMNRLRTNGFQVQHVFPKTVRVTWFPPEEPPDAPEGSTSVRAVGSSVKNAPHLIGYKNEKGKFVLNV